VFSCLASQIRGFLTAGVLIDGLVGPTEEGTPQGGPLSPLLSNLMLCLKHGLREVFEDGGRINHAGGPSRRPRGHAGIQRPELVAHVRVRGVTPQIGFDGLADGAPRPRI
jgi:hypothetical protein